LRKGSISSISLNGNTGRGSGGPLLSSKDQSEECTLVSGGERLEGLEKEIKAKFKDYADKAGRLAASGSAGPKKLAGIMEKEIALLGNE